MWKALWKWFIGDKPRPVVPEPGQVWGVPAELDVFGEIITKERRVVILQVRDGWVQFRHAGSEQKFSWRTSLFVFAHNLWVDASAE